MYKGSFVVYYVYANEVTKELHFYPSDREKLENCHLLWMVKCVYSSKDLYNPRVYRPAVTGVYLDAGGKNKIEVLDWAWYGLKYSIN